MLDDIPENVLKSDGSEFTIYNHVKAQYSRSSFSWSLVEIALRGSGVERDYYLN